MGHWRNYRQGQLGFTNVTHALFRLTLENAEKGTAISDLQFPWTTQMKILATQLWTCWIILPDLETVIWDKQPLIGGLLSGKGHNLSGRCQTVVVAFLITNESLRQACRFVHVLKYLTAMIVVVKIVIHLFTLSQLISRFQCIPDFRTLCNGSWHLLIKFELKQLSI